MARSQTCPLSRNSWRTQHEICVNQVNHPSLTRSRLLQGCEFQFETTRKVNHPIPPAIAFLIAVLQIKPPALASGVFCWGFSDLKISFFTKLYVVSYFARISARLRVRYGSISSIRTPPAFHPCSKCKGVRSKSTTNLLLQSGRGHSEGGTQSPNKLPQLKHRNRRILSGSATLVSSKYFQQCLNFPQRRLTLGDFAPY